MPLAPLIETRAEVAVVICPTCHGIASEEFDIREPEERERALDTYAEHFAAAHG